MTGAGFLAWARPRRLTPRRMALTLGTCALACLGIVILAPLIGVESDRTGRHLVLLDLRAALDPSTIEHQVFFIARLPRVLAAAAIGAALASAGCTFQAVLRNPLAEPFTLGVSSGSALAAVIAIRFGLGDVLGGVGIAALTGAATTMILVWQLGRVGALLPPATLLLAGVAVAMFCSAGSMVVQYTSSFAEVTRMLHWMMGSIEYIPYRALLDAAVPISVGLVVLLFLGRDLNALAAGPEAAASVGVSPGRAQGIAFATASVLVGASISLGGPIGFIGLLVPHGLRALIGPDHRLLVPATMLVGAALLVTCDTLARLVIWPAGLPVGVVTALFGGPFFIVILLRMKRSVALWVR